MAVLPTAILLIPDITSTSYRWSCSSVVVNSLIFLAMHNAGEKIGVVVGGDDTGTGEGH